MLEVPDPTDVPFVADSRMSADALCACVEAGVPIPDDVIIGGLDDLPWADLVQPSITSSRQQHTHGAHRVDRVVLAGPPGRKSISDDRPRRGTSGPRRPRSAG